jgi:uncharacterized protein
MNRSTSVFGDQSALAERLLAASGTEGTDGSHDWSHLLRVWQNAKAIAGHQLDCDHAVLVAAVILHD